MSQKMRTQAGYSLTEMLVVIAIIGMLALVMVPNFVTFYESNKMKSSVRNFTSDLRSVRQLAITRGRQTAICFATGSGQRSYDWYLGNLPFNSTSWTPQTGAGLTRPTKYLDDIAFFPTAAAPTPQTFTDVIDCSVNPCVAGTDSRIDVIFNPDGSVIMPPAATSGTITMMTLLNKIPKPQYTITISPSGRVITN